MIFIPGFMCDARLFRHQLDFLSARGFRCLVANVGSESRIDMMAEFILKTAPNQFALAGLSMGGIVALELFRQAPQRVTDLVLMNMTPFEDRNAEQRKAHIQRVKNGDMSRVISEDLKPHYLAPANADPKITALINSMAQHLGAASFVSQTIALMTRRSYIDVLDDIGCPTLIMTGDQDQICPVKIHELMAEKIGDSQFTLIPNCGHISTLERPQFVNQAILDFLSNGLMQRNGSTQRKTSAMVTKLGVER